MNSRINEIQKALDLHKIDALLITNETNVSYLSCFQSSESWLLVTKKNVFYITDFRYLYEVEKKIKDVTLICYQKSFYDTVEQLAKMNNVKSLGVDPDSLTIGQFEALNKKVRHSVKLKLVRGIVEYLRQSKEKGELAKINKALSIHRRAHQYLKRIIKPGVTEQDVFLKLNNFVRAQKAGFSFDPIIASGPNSCYPHAKVTNRKIKNNEPVLIDMGVDVEGYKSDLTRMFFLGKISKLVLEVNGHVKEAQQRAIRAIKPGKKIEKIDNQARNYLKEKNLDSYFGHALGHGVGLDIHESPRISGKNNEVLVENMVITIEPAVYLPGKFGIRIEDMVCVTKKGYKILSDDIY